MFDWFCSSTVYGFLFALLPFAYILRKALVQKEKRRSELLEAPQAQLITEQETEPKVEPEQSPIRIDDEQLQLMRGTVDLITYRLSLIESSIYKDLNPKPHLTTEEYIAAAQQMRDVVRRLKRMPKISMPMPVSIPPKLQEIYDIDEYLRIMND